MTFSTGCCGVEQGLGAQEASLPWTAGYLPGIADRFEPRRTMLLVRFEVIPFGPFIPALDENQLPIGLGFAFDLPAKQAGKLLLELFRRCIQGDCSAQARPRGVIPVRNRARMDNSR